MEQLCIGQSCRRVKRIRSADSSRPSSSRSHNIQRDPHQRSESDSLPVKVHLDSLSNLHICPIGRGDAGLTGKTAPPPLLPPRPLHPPLPFPSSPWKLRPASHLMRTLPHPTCLAMAVSSSCLSWTLCLLLHLHSMNRNGSRSDPGSVLLWREAVQ